IHDLDREIRVTPQTLRSMMDETASKFWGIVRLILSLGGVAMLLAVIGIYGVVASAVSQRTKEMGIRLALGATKADIIRLVLGSGIKRVLAGLTAGLVLALAGGRIMTQVLRGMPFALKVEDPLVFVAVSVLLLATATGAMLGPSFRAAKSDPMRTLRQD